jgi:hypothetical protein
MKKTTAQDLKQLKAGITPVVYYKGFGITYMYGRYRAAAYANPTFEETSKAKLIKEINKYLTN